MAWAIEDGRGSPGCFEYNVHGPLHRLQGLGAQLGPPWETANHGGGFGVLCGGGSQPVGCLASPEEEGVPMPSWVPGGP